MSTSYPEDDTTRKLKQCRIQLDKIEEDMAKLKAEKAKINKLVETLFRVEGRDPNQYGFGEALRFKRSLGNFAKGVVSVKDVSDGGLAQSETS